MTALHQLPQNDEGMAGLQQLAKILVESVLTRL